MKSNKWTFLAPIATLAMTLQVQAYEQLIKNDPPKHHQYKLLQVSTFGGASSTFATGPDNFFENYFNGHGTTVGLADTNIADPLAPFCFFADCMVTKGFTFDVLGTLKDLGSLPGGNTSSVAYGLNNDGVAVGVSSTGQFDPTTGFPKTHAVIWIDGQIVDLGTLGGASSQAFAVNNAGEVIGVSANSVPDTYSGAIGPCTGWSCWTVSTQQRAFLWKDGTTRDLGTLGGPDAVAYYLNGAGQVAGVSYTNNTPNATTGNPTQDPFLWTRGTMVDLGGLGGTYGAVAGLNHRGEVAGFSNLAGDQTYHPFLWAAGTMTDLGTLGGDSGFAYALGSTGDVVGQAQTAGNAANHAFLWAAGTMTDLGTLASDPTGTSEAYAVNSKGQVVGYANIDGTPAASAFLWEEGGPMVDLNALVENPPASGLHLLYAYAISNDGEILAIGLLPTGQEAVVMLVQDGLCGAKCEAQAGLVTGVTSPLTGGEGKGH